MRRKFMFTRTGIHIIILYKNLYFFVSELTHWWYPDIPCGNLHLYCSLSTLKKPYQVPHAVAFRFPDGLRVSQITSHNKSIFRNKTKMLSSVVNTVIIIRVVFVNRVIRITVSINGLEVFARGLISGTYFTFRWNCFHSNCFKLRQNK